MAGMVNPFAREETEQFADDLKPQGVKAAHLNLAEEIGWLEEVVDQLKRKLSIVLLEDFPQDGSKDPGEAAPRESDMTNEVRMSTARLYNLRNKLTDVLNRIDF